MGPLRKYVRVLPDVCKLTHFFAARSYRRCLIKECLRPRRIGICPVKTVVSALGSGRKGAQGAPVFEGHIRYPHGLKAFLNRRISFCPEKKMRNYLHICKICSTFALEMIRFTTDDTAMPALDERQTGRWIRAVAAYYGFAVGNINYIFCSDERELAVNREFLGHDYYTDIITFDYSTAQTLNGDIFISLDTVRSNAEMVGVPFEQELNRILIHGILHLTGQGDKTPETKAEMTKKEEHALALL